MTGIHPHAAHLASACTNYVRGGIPEPRRRVCEEVIAVGVGPHDHVVEDWAVDAATPDLYFYSLNGLTTKAMDYIMGHHDETRERAALRGEGDAGGEAGAAAAPLPPPPRAVSGYGAASRDGKRPNQLSAGRDAWCGR